jgi:hypothetical protein
VDQHRDLEDLEQFLSCPLAEAEFTLLRDDADEAGPVRAFQTFAEIEPVLDGLRTEHGENVCIEAQDGWGAYFEDGPADVRGVVAAVERGHQLRRCIQLHVWTTLGLKTRHR